MRQIKKQPEPSTLTSYRLGTPDTPNWDGYGEKRTAQAQVCEEQRRICFFCQRRIRPDEQPTDGPLRRNMKIAHFVPRKSKTGKKNPDLEVTWSNLFGVCMGGEGSLPEIEQHCDTKQKDSELHVALHPLTLRPGTVKFRRSGDVYSDDPQVNADLNEKLHLNARTPKSARVAARDALISLMDDKTPGRWSKTTIERRMGQIEQQEPLAPYCDYLLFILRERLRAEVG